MGAVHARSVASPPAFRRRQAPLRPGNAFTLIGDGHEFFKRMLGAIETSQSYVLAEFYLVESGQITDAFIAVTARAAARGVKIRVVFDAFGARGLSESDRARLRDSGVELAFYNGWRRARFASLLLRDHRKILLIDGRVGFTGGAGIMDAFSPAARPQAWWQDCMVEVSGPVLEDWHALFADTWRRCSHRRLDIPPSPTGTAHPGEAGRVSASAGLGRQDLGRRVIARVRRAQRRVWIATPYFWPSMRLRRALKRAARKGVDVRLILTGPHTDAPRLRGFSRFFYGRLLTSGVRIHEFQPRFMHCKAVLADDWVSLGSSNLDRWGALWNLDANQEVESPEFARSVERFLATLCLQSTVLHSARDVQHSLGAYVWRQVARAAYAWSMRAASRLQRR